MSEINKKETAVVAETVEKLPMGNPFGRPTEEVTKPAAIESKVEDSVKQTKSKEVSKNMNAKVVTPMPAVVPFYYGYYSVNHATKKGEYMEPLHSITGETRKCPCYSIAIKLDNVILLCENGYTLKNLDTSLFKGKSITKRNINDYVTYINNMITNGFLK